MNSDKVLIRRKKKTSKSLELRENIESWVGYWRANPHRFITEYLGLKLYDFQNYVMYQMTESPNTIYIASRGLAKSTVGLLCALGLCVLYPGIKVVIVAPAKGQSSRFLKTVKDFIRKSPNLAKEIQDVKIGKDESSVSFFNTSEIFTAVYGENALGTRCNVLIIDEFVRTDKEIIARVFLPFLTSPRTPPYLGLTNRERNVLPVESNRQIYLSSIRGADEWSYVAFLEYIEHILKGNNRYMALALPYHFGVMNKYITEEFVIQYLNDNKDMPEMIKAEMLCIPEKGSAGSFFKYRDLEKARDNSKAMVSMSDEQYIQHRTKMSGWEYHQDKFPNEIRLLTMDVALIESANNDNTSFWLIRLIPKGNKYVKIVSYGESLHGLNSIVQTTRAKQLFYEMDCDYFVLDTQGNGMNTCPLY